MDKIKRYDKCVGEIKIIMSVIAKNKNWANSIRVGQTKMKNGTIYWNKGTN